MPHDEHVTRDLLMAVLEGRAESSDLLRRLLTHLADLCPRCREELQVFLETDPPELELPAPEAPRIPPAFWTAVQEERQHRDSVLVPAAQEELQTLLHHSQEEREDLIRHSEENFRNPVLAQLLLDRYWEQVTVDAEEAHHLAHLALDIAKRLPSDRYGCWLRRDLALRSRACVANALRAVGDLRGADQHMREVLKDLESSPEPLLQAEIFSFAASLRKDQRRFDEAESLLDQALELYRQINDLPKAARVLINRANLDYERGRPQEASEITREALTLIDQKEHPQLFLHVEHNLATYLCDAGEYEKARHRLEGHANLSDQYPEAHFRLRRRWLEGRIALGLGEVDKAEALLEKVRDGYAAQDLGYDAALVNLDLALLYTEQGRTQDVRRLSEEMLPIFQSQDVHREAMAALLIFRRAATEETVSAQMVRDLAGYLRQARHNPRLRHELPS